MKKYAFGLYLLCIASWAIAANPTFDVSNNRLTLPIVEVGAQSYSDVVLELKSFNVVSVGTIPSTGSTRSCTGSISTGVFAFTINPQSKIIEGTFTANQTVLVALHYFSFTQNGTTYTLSSAALSGNYIVGSIDSMSLISGSKATFRLNQFPTSFNLSTGFVVTSLLTGEQFTCS